MKTESENKDHVPDEFSQARALREKLLEGQNKMRKRRAALSFSDKIKILEKLKDRGNAIASAGLKQKRGRTSGANAKAKVIKLYERI